MRDWSLVANRCRELVAAHGGQRSAARALGLDVGYFSRLLNGTKQNPSDDVLNRLGMERMETFRSIGPPTPSPTPKKDDDNG
jgi:transcriptional regulator with XRE-family HTH domain